MLIWEDLFRINRRLFQRLGKGTLNTSRMFCVHKRTYFSPSLLECKVLLCDFHREQAWERWVSKTAHGVAAFKEEVLAKLRRIAHASTTTEYETAVNVLKEWHVWKTNSSFSPGGGVLRQ